MEKTLKANCNRCSKKGCKGSVLPFEIEMVNPELNCKTYVRPKEGFILAEMALTYPSSLNESLSALPFETNLGFHLK